MKNVVETINKYSEEDEELRPIVNRMKNKLTFNKKVDGKMFVAKLVAIRGDLLFYETRDGSIAVNNINDIASISEYHPKQRDKTSQKAAI